MDSDTIPPHILEALDNFLLKPEVKSRLTKASTSDLERKVVELEKTVNYLSQEVTSLRGKLSPVSPEEKRPEEAKDISSGTATPINWDQLISGAGKILSNISHPKMDVASTISGIIELASSVTQSPTETNQKTEPSGLFQTVIAVATPEPKMEEKKRKPESLPAKSSIDLNPALSKAGKLASAFSELMRDNKDQPPKVERLIPDFVELITEFNPSIAALPEEERKTKIEGAIQRGFAVMKEQEAAKKKLAEIFSVGTESSSAPEPKVEEPKVVPEVRSPHTPPDLLSVLSGLMANGTIPSNPALVSVLSNTQVLANSDLSSAQSVFKKVMFDE